MSKVYRMGSKEKSRMERVEKIIEEHLIGLTLDECLATLVDIQIECKERATVRV